MSFEKLSAWFSAHARPLWEASFAGDLAGARQHYHAALRSIDSEADPDLRQAMYLRILAAWLFVLAEVGDRSELAAMYGELLRACAASQPGPLSVRYARLKLLLGHLLADSLELEELTPLQLVRLLKEIPDAERGPNLWHHLACWAFGHGDDELLEEAYAYFTTQRPAVMADWMFARLQLMRRLRRGSASEADVLETVRRMEVLAQLEDFRRVLQGACEGQGLLGDEVRRALRAQQEVLETSGRRPPQQR